MSTSITPTRTGQHADPARLVRLHTEETKPSWKTTELLIYVLAFIGVLVASVIAGDGGNNDRRDYFTADKAWWFITLLTIGYMLSRGLATSGSNRRDHL